MDFAPSTGMERTTLLTDPGPGIWYLAKCAGHYDRMLLSLLLCAAVQVLAGWLTPQNGQSKAGFVDVSFLSVHSCRCVWKATSFLLREQGEHRKSVCPPVEKCPAFRAGLSCAWSHWGSTWICQTDFEKLVYGFQRKRRTSTKCSECVQKNCDCDLDLWMLCS